MIITGEGAAVLPLAAIRPQGSRKRDQFPVVWLAFCIFLRTLVLLGL